MGSSTGRYRVVWSSSGRGSAAAPSARDDKPGNGAADEDTVDLEAAYRAAIGNGQTECWLDLGTLLCDQAGRELEAERAFRAAVDAGHSEGWLGLGHVLSGRRERWDEAEAACRNAATCGHAAGWRGLGWLLLKRGREDEAEAAYREAVAVGHAQAWNGLGWALAKRAGGEAEAERAFREAIAAGDINGWGGLGSLLARQPGREQEAAAAYRQAIAGGGSDDLVRQAGLSLGQLLAQQGDLAGARAAYEAALRACGERAGVEMPDRAAAIGARIRLAIDRRPWALRVNRAVCRVIDRLRGG